MPPTREAMQIACSFLVKNRDNFPLTRLLRSFHSSACVPAYDPVLPDRACLRGVTAGSESVVFKVLSAVSSATLACDRASGARFGCRLGAVSPHLSYRFAITRVFVGLFDTRLTSREGRGLIFRSLFLWPPVRRRCLLHNRAHLLLFVVWLFFHFPIDSASDASWCHPSDISFHQTICIILARYLFCPASHPTGKR